LIPARTSGPTTIGDIEWPRDSTPQKNPIQQPPHGIQHRYACLALVEFSNGEWKILGDCRGKYVPLTTPSLAYVSGDGQEAMPFLADAAKRPRIPRPLVIAAFNSHWCNGVKLQIKCIGAAGQLAQRPPGDETGPSDPPGNATGLEFDTVSVDLNELAHSDPEWWTLGKMMTYRAQTEPFAHIDEDVFLWQRLPRELEQAPVFAKNAEYFSCAAWWYQPEALESVVKEHRGWLPDEWIWYRSSGQAQRGECCGIVGGSRVDFVRYWADLGIRMIEHPRNRDGWYLLAVCVEYHRNRPGSPYNNIAIQSLLDSESNPSIPPAPLETDSPI
jgi:hypothetical protein